MHCITVFAWNTSIVNLLQIWIEHMSEYTSTHMEKNNNLFYDSVHNLVL